MCRFWKPTNEAQVPALLLARNAYAAQLADGPFFDTLKKDLHDLGMKHDIGIQLNAEEMRYEKLNEIVVKNAHGSTAELTSEIITSSVEEFVGLRTMELSQERDALIDTVAKKTKTLDDANHQLVIAWSVPFINKLGWLRILVFAANYIVFFAFALVAIHYIRSKQLLQREPILLDYCGNHATACYC